MCQYEQEETPEFNSALTIDICPLGDNSGDTNDGLCEGEDSIESNEQGPVVPKEVVIEDIQIVSDTGNAQDDTRNLADKFLPSSDDAPARRISDTFQRCSITRDIQNPLYDYRKQGVFVDENDSDSKDTILKFAEIGIINGFEDSTFRPLQEMTRTEFLKLALISHCYEYNREDTSDLRYTDIDPQSWQARVIKKAENLGMINGDITEEGIPIFRPDDIITKAEAIKILMNISQIRAEEQQSLLYTDIVVDWHK